MTEQRAGTCRCGHEQTVHDEAGYGICEFDGPCDCVKYEPQRATCHCGAEIEWMLRPMLPFPDVATMRQLAEQGTGRWVHVLGSGSAREREWCSPLRAFPATLSGGTVPGDSPTVESAGIGPE